VEGEEDQRGLPTLVSEQPADTLKMKRQKVPMLTGVNSAETVRAVFGKNSCRSKKHDIRFGMHGQQHVTLYTCSSILALIPLK
jgi:hypothetical protein